MAALKIFSWQLDHKSWQPETRRPIQFTPTVPRSAAKSQFDSHVSAPIDAPETIRAHITRLLGKRCFSCGTTSTVHSKFCAECGAPLFRPGHAPAST